MLDVAVDDPLDALFGPVDTVGVELGLGVGNGDVVLAVTEGAVTLSEVVGLNVGGVGADLLLFLHVRIIIQWFADSISGNLRSRSHPGRRTPESRC